MKQPPGFEKIDSEGRPLLCKLHKALYGLKQGPMLGLKILVAFLLIN